MLSGGKHTNPLMSVVLCFTFLSIYSCGPKEIHEGIYEVEDQKTSSLVEPQIELREKGVGIWRVLDEEASFRWAVKDSEIRLSTKLGGTIIGKIRGGIIEITLPGLKTMFFKKTIFPQYNGGG